MEWTFGEGSVLRLALIGAVGWIANYIRPKIVPWMKERLRTWKNTERIDALEAEIKVIRVRLHIAESKQMAALHTAPDPIFIMNPGGELVYANPAWGLMTGFTNIEDAYGKGYMQAIPPHDRDEIEKQNERLVEHPGSFEGEIRFRHLRTKDIINTICRSEPVHDDKEKVIETIGRLYIVTIKN